MKKFSFILSFILFSTFIFPAPSQKDYIFKDSSTKLLNESTLSLLDGRLLELSRNEIYARHGHIFKNKFLKEFFTSKNWYSENSSYNDSLNKIESQNVALIKKYETLVKNSKLINSYGCLKDYSNISYRKKHAEIDLNGDGINEVIDLKIINKDETEEWISIVSKNYEIAGTPFITSFTIVDLDIFDNSLEVAVEDGGPSSDYTTTFYRYDGKNFTEIGFVQGYCGNSESVDGLGKITASTRSILFQTWYYADEYRVTADNKLKKIPHSFYPIDVPTKLKLLKPIQLFKSPTDHTVVASLKIGTIIYFMGSDEVKYGLFKTADGVQGWQNISYENGLSQADLDGLIICD